VICKSRMKLVEDGEWWLGQDVFCPVNYWTGENYGKFRGPKFKPELAECGGGLLATWLSCFKTETSVPLKIWFKEKDFACLIFCSDYFVNFWCYKLHKWTRLPVSFCFNCADLMTLLLPSWSCCLVYTVYQSKLQ